MYIKFSQSKSIFRLSMSLNFANISSHRVFLMLLVLWSKFILYHHFNLSLQNVTIESPTPKKIAQVQLFCSMQYEKLHKSIIPPKKRAPNEIRLLNSIISYCNSKKKKLIRLTSSQYKATKTNKKCIRYIRFLVMLPQSY